MTVWETIQRGEYVMFALAVALIVAVCICWVRCVVLSRKMKGYVPLMHRVRDHVVEGDLENAARICNVTDSPGARVIESGISRIGQPMQEVTLSMKQRGDLEKENMRKGTGWLKCIAVISPLLGLGGTLVGMIDRLRDLGESTVEVTTGMVCAALSPTIVTTVAGLCVGILSLILLTGLESRIEASKRRLDALSLEFTSLLNQPS